VSVAPDVEDRADLPKNAPEALRTFEYTVRAAETTASVSRSVIVLNRATRAPVEDARFEDAAGEILTEPRCGRFVLRGGESEGDVWVRSPGYQPGLLPRNAQAGTSAPDTLLLDPWFGGKLSGKRVMIDPEGDAGRESVRGPLGLSGSYASLQVARCLRDYLEAAGTHVGLSDGTKRHLSRETWSP